MNLEDTKAMIELMKDNDLTEFDYETEDTKIHLKRGGSAVNFPAAPSQPTATAATNLIPETVNAELVGTFYRAPSPEDDPYVSVGDKVVVGQVIGMIEAMKMMHDVKAPYSGTLKQILVGNEESVEYAQPLFEITAE